MKVWYRGMAKAFVLMAAVVVLTMALAACGGSSTPSGGGSSSGSINVTETEFKITPNTFSAPAGKVTFVIKNAGTVQHDIGVDIKGTVDHSPLVDPGKTVTWTTSQSLSAGTYQVSCTVAGHKESGMTATLTVQ